MSIEEQLRALGDHLDEVQEPITADQVRHRSATNASDVPSPARRRLLLVAAVIVLMIAGVVSLVALEARDEDPLQPVDTGVVTVPATTPVPSETLLQPESTEQPEAETADPGSDQPPALQRPVSGQTQRSVVGNIMWTLLEGDASSVPQGPVIGVDGGYLGGVHDGRTWRSSDGLEWELADLGGDGVADEAVYGEFDFRGETWAQTNDGVARWAGDTFVPVALPESPFVELDGLNTVRRSVGAPVVVGDELVIPVTTELEIPWRELFTGDARAEWAGDPQSIRIIDFNWSGPEPRVLAVLSADFIDGEPGRFEFRDVESDELVTTVDVIPGVEPAEYLPRVLEGVHREILIGDDDGFEAVEPPGGWGAPGDSRVRRVDGGVVPIDGGLLGVARVGYESLLPSEGGLGPDDWELWTSVDARSWTRLDLPATEPDSARSRIEDVSMASDGSTALLRIDAWIDGQGGETRWWATADGRRWEEITVPAGQRNRPDVMSNTLSIEYAEFGWLIDNFEYNIAISPDGRTWQEVQFDFLEILGDGGASAVGRSIFVVPTPGAEEPGGPTHSMWVGRVDDG